ncbi:MAG: alpha/beta fold hydrolase [Actinomycetota bacterium]|nr:alpha/beta fold hydrolase [Actinomycetota bacterium]
MTERIASGDLTLAGHLAMPDRVARSGAAALVICHGFPSTAGGGANSYATYPALADHIAEELGWAVLTFSFRGCGESEGDFSLGGWLDDIGAAVTHVRSILNTAGVWLSGFGTAGALSICAGSRDPEIDGVAAMAAPADFDDWASHPKRLLDFARDINVIRDPRFPASIEQWVHELRSIRAVACVESLRPRPLLVVHGSDDVNVPVFDARVIGDAHATADLRVISGAGHHLRHDPRAIAILCGWLDRQAVRSGVERPA